jgi:transcriptional regulator with XRE-family HTH domain
VRGRRLARELRRIREELKLTVYNTADRTEWDQGKVSRIENAKMRCTTGEVMELCEAYGITGDQRAELIQLARDARKQGWWHPYRDVLKVGFGDYLAFEAEAVGLRWYEIHLIPGLFQTEDYARAVLGSSRFRTPEETERAVQARLDRQKHLTSTDDPIQVWLILEEAALRRIIGDAATMRGQLERLLEVGKQPNVSIQVVPYRAATHAALDGPFLLMAFDGYPNVLYIEHFMGCQYYEKSEETTHASVVFDHLRASALNAADSAALIRHVIKETFDPQ